MIDYITLLLVNSAIGLLAGAAFLWKGLGGPDQNHRPWAALFAAAGLVSLVMGVHMAATWPIPPGKARFANVAFGEISVLFGALMLGLALSLARGWSLVPIAIYSAVTGATSVVLGAAIGSLGLTAKPPLTAAGYILAGLGAILVLPAVWRPSVRPLRFAAGALLALAALVWLATGFPAYWMHLDMFSK